MSMVTGGRSGEPGTIGISIEVIEYDGATGTYTTVKSVKFAPNDTPTNPAQGKLAPVRERIRLSLNPGGDR